MTGQAPVENVNARIAQRAARSSLCAAARGESPQRWPSASELPAIRIEDARSPIGPGVYNVKVEWGLRYPAGMKVILRYAMFCGKLFWDAVVSFDTTGKKVGLLATVILLVGGISGLTWDSVRHEYQTLSITVIAGVVFVRLTWPLFVRIENMEQSAGRPTRELLDGCLKFTDELLSLESELIAPLPPAGISGRVTSVFYKLQECEQRLLAFVRNEDWAPLFEQTRRNLGLVHLNDAGTQFREVRNLICGYRADLKTMLDGVKHRLATPAR